VWKLKRKNTPSDQERIKELEDRLDAAVAESKRMRAEMDELQRRTDVRDFNRLRKQAKLTIGETRPDETVN
jgi:molecular chaperone GrpE (heat shock protein)